MLYTPAAGAKYYAFIFQYQEFRTPYWGVLDCHLVVSTFSLVHLGGGGNRFKVNGSHRGSDGRLQSLSPSWTALLRVSDFSPPWE